MSNSSSSSLHSEQVFKQYGFDRSSNMSDSSSIQQRSITSSNVSSGSLFIEDEQPVVQSETYLYKPPAHYPNAESVLLFTMNLPSTISNVNNSSSVLLTVSLYASPLPSLPTRSKHTHIQTLVLTLNISPLFIYTCNISETSQQEMKTQQHQLVDMPGLPAYLYALFSHILDGKNKEEKVKHTFQCHFETSNIETSVEEDLVEDVHIQNQGILRIIEITPYKHIEHLCLSLQLPNASTRCLYLKELTLSLYERGKTVLSAQKDERKKNEKYSQEIDLLEQEQEKQQVYIQEEKDRQYVEYDKKVTEMNNNVDKIHHKNMSNIAQLKTEYEMKYMSQKEEHGLLEKQVQEQSIALKQAYLDIETLKSEKEQLQNQVKVTSNAHEQVKVKFEEILSQMSVWKVQLEENSRVIVHLKDQLESSKIENIQLRDISQRNQVEKSKLVETVNLLKLNMQQSEAQITESVGEINKSNELIYSLQKEKAFLLKKCEKYKQYSAEYKDKVVERETQLKDIHFTWEKLHLQFEEQQKKYNTAYTHQQEVEKNQSEFDKTIHEKDKQILWLNKELEYSKDGNHSTSKKNTNNSSIVTPYHNNANMSSTNTSTTNAPYSPLAGTMPNSIGMHTHMLSHPLHQNNMYPSLTPSLSPMHMHIQSSPVYNNNNNNNNNSKMFQSPIVHPRFENKPTPKLSITNTNTSSPQYSQVHTQQQLLTPTSYKNTNTTNSTKLPGLPTPNIPYTPPQPSKDVLNESHTTEPPVPSPKPALVRPTNTPKPTQRPPPQSTPEQQAHQTFLATLAKLTNLPS